jgi:hypothetical protein
MKYEDWNIGLTWAYGYSMYPFMDALMKCNWHKAAFMAVPAGTILFALYLVNLKRRKAQQ